MVGTENIQSLPYSKRKKGWRRGRGGVGTARLFWASVHFLRKLWSPDLGLCIWMVFPVFSHFPNVDLHRLTETLLSTYSLWAKPSSQATPQPPASECGPDRLPSLSLSPSGHLTSTGEALGPLLLLTSTGAPPSSSPLLGPGWREGSVQTCCWGRRCGAELGCRCWGAPLPLGRQMLGSPPPLKPRKPPSLPSTSSRTFHFPS